MRIEVGALPPEEYSPNWRGHPIEKHRAGKIYRQLVFYTLVSARNLVMREKSGWVPYKVARLDLTFVFPEQRARDEDNMRARFKPGQDALVQAGYILTDTPKHLVLGKIEMIVDPDRAPLTIIDIREANLE